MILEKYVFSEFQNTEGHRRTREIQGGLEILGKPKRCMGMCVDIHG